MADASRAELDALLTHAFELAGGERERFLDASCGRGTARRATVERMLLAGEAEDSAIRPGAGAHGPLWESLAHEVSSVGSPVPGERLAAYRIERTVGRGGMATVYLARRADGQYEQTVAIKVLDSFRQSGQLAERFARERQILASLDHPNIARLIDGGVSDSGQPFLVMEYVEGMPIDEYCDGHRLDIPGRLALFDRVADAVQYAHRHLIIHRDLKPSNILVNSDGQPKLLDFGIAKLLDADAPDVPETRLDALPMTPEYASPEQLRGEALTTASDVHQLGNLLYRLLTGEPPYPVDRRSLAAMIETVSGAEPPRPASRVGAASVLATAAAARSTTPARLRRRLRGDLGHIPLMALRGDVHARYGSVAEMRDDLDRYLHGRPIRARRSTWRYRSAQFVRRHWIGISAGSLLIVAIILGAGATLWQARIAAGEARRAAQVSDFLTGLFESAAPDATRGQAVTVKSVLDRGARELDSRLAGEPALRAEMLGVIGRIYAELGLYSAAEPLLANALDLQRAHGGAPEIARGTNDLANLALNRGRYDEAARLARESVTLERGLGPSADLARSLATLAAVALAQGDTGRAEALYREAIGIDRRFPAPAALADHLAGLGAVLAKQTRYREAKTAYEFAISTERRTYGEVHTRVATSLLRLAAVDTDLGDYSAAESSARAGLAMRQRLLGPEHPDVAGAYAELGFVLQEAGRNAEAEFAFREALEIGRASLGADHPEVANLLNHLAISLYYRGEYAEAAEIFARVLENWRRTLGAGHADVLSVMNNLGAAYREAGDYEAAERVLRESLAARIAAFGNEHRQVAQSHNNLALVLAARHKYAEAEENFLGALEIWRRTMGNEHPDVADGLAGYGRFLLQRGRFGEAEPVLREAVDLRARILDPNAPLLATARIDLASTLLALGRIEEADALARAGMPVIAAHWGDESDVARRARGVAVDITRRRDAIAPGARPRD